MAGVVGFLGLMLLITGLLAAAWSAQSPPKPGLPGNWSIAAYGLLGLVAAWAVVRLRGWGQWCAVVWAVTLALAFPGCLQVIAEVAGRLIQPWQRGGPDWGALIGYGRFWLDMVGILAPLLLAPSILFLFWLVIEDVAVALTAERSSDTSSNSDSAVRDAHKALDSSSLWLVGLTAALILGVSALGFRPALVTSVLDAPLEIIVCPVGALLGFLTAIGLGKLRRWGWWCAVVWTAIYAEYSALLLIGMAVPAGEPANRFPIWAILAWSGMWLVVTALLVGLLVVLRPLYFLPGARHPASAADRRVHRIALIAATVILLAAWAAALLIGDWLLPALLGGAALLAVGVWYGLKVGVVFPDRAAYLQAIGDARQAEKSDAAERLRPAPQTVRRSRGAALIASALVLMATPAGAFFMGDWLRPGLLAGIVLLAVWIWYGCKVGIVRHG